MIPLNIENFRREIRNFPRSHGRTTLSDLKQEAFIPSVADF
jgi:hypothetical protein